MPESRRSYVWGIRYIFLGAAIVAVILLIGISVWPFLTPAQLPTPKGGANPATAPDTTASRGTPAQRAAESTVGKNNPAGEGANGARYNAIKQSSQPLQLDAQQRQQIKDAIAHQSDAPRIQKAPFELMIGTAVPHQVELKDLPSQIAQAMNGFWGDQYVLVQNEMVIVDQHSRRVVAIVPSVA